MNQTEAITGTGRQSSLVSGDGTRISYLSFGQGPAALVVPGALSTAADYANFARALAQRFMVHIIERRGRGASGPQGADYGIAREREDLLALQQKTGATFIVGHSFGGLVALEAARNNPALNKIAVYEPGVSIGGSISMNWMAAYEQKLAQEKRLDAFAEFSIGSGPLRARSMPPWLMKLLLRVMLSSHERQQRLSLLHEGLREHRVVAQLDSSYENYREVSASVLLMYGGKSDQPWIPLAMQQLANTLPRSKMGEFPKLDHFAIDKKAPQVIAALVSEFFLA